MKVISDYIFADELLTVVICGPSFPVEKRVTWNEKVIFTADGLVQFDTTTFIAFGKTLASLPGRSQQHDAERAHADLLWKLSSYLARTEFERCAFSVIGAVVQKGIF